MANPIIADQVKDSRTFEDRIAMLEAQVLCLTKSVSSLQGEHMLTRSLQDGVAFSAQAIRLR